MSNNADGGHVARAVAELYAGLPEDFTRRRKELATAARSVGDLEAARLITALRKPTRAAWVVNRLAHAEPGVAAILADLAAGLRAAEEARDGPRLRDLSSRRQALIDGLTGQALGLAGMTDSPPGLRAEVSATLAAALASQEVADHLAAGTLTHAVSWSGFGLASELAVGEGSPGTADEAVAGEEAAATDEATAPVPLPPQAPRRLPPQRARSGPRQPAVSPSAPVASPVLAALPEAAGSVVSAALPGAAASGSAASGAAPSGPAASGAALPKAGRAPRGTAPRGLSVEDAEGAVATAAAVAAQAAAAEERLEVHVRDLEQQLTKARAELANARLRARHTEVAERKARQALARVQSPASR